jgi:hypothetical protein
MASAKPKRTKISRQLLVDALVWNCHRYTRSGAFSACNHFTDPSRAVTIQPNDPLYQGEEITMLLMPMLVNE